MMITVQPSLTCAAGKNASTGGRTWRLSSVPAPLVVASSCPAWSNARRSSIFLPSGNPSPQLKKVGRAGARQRRVRTPLQCFAEKRCISKQRSKRGRYVVSKRGAFLDPKTGMGGVAYIYLFKVHKTRCNVLPKRGAFQKQTTSVGGVTKQICRGKVPVGALCNPGYNHYPPAAARQAHVNPECGSRREAKQNIIGGSKEKLAALDLQGTRAPCSVAKLA